MFFNNLPVEGEHCRYLYLNTVKEKKNFKTLVRCLMHSSFLKVIQFPHLFSYSEFPHSVLAPSSPGQLMFLEVQLWTHSCGVPQGSDKVPLMRCSSRF